MATWMSVRITSKTAKSILAVGRDTLQEWWGSDDCNDLLYAIQQAWEDHDYEDEED